jgi:hypothetical protein
MDRGLEEMAAVMMVDRGTTRDKKAITTIKEDIHRRDIAKE